MSDSQQTPSNLYLRVIIIKSGRFKFSQFPSLSLNNEYPHVPFNRENTVENNQIVSRKKEYLIHPLSDKGLNSL